MGDNITTPLDPEDMNKDQLKFAISQEIENWKKANIHPNGVTHDIFAMDVQVMTVVWVLIDEGIISEENFQERYLRRMLDKFIQQRKQAEQQLKAMRALEGISLPQKKPLLGPDGQPL